MEKCGTLEVGMECEKFGLPIDRLAKRNAGGPISMYIQLKCHYYVYECVSVGVRHDHRPGAVR